MSSSDINQLASEGVIKVNFSSNDLLPFCNHERGISKLTGKLIEMNHLILGN